MHPAHMVWQTLTPVTLQAEEAASSATLVVALGILVLLIAGLWKMFEKAGQAGWKAIIPLYNVFILLKIAGRPGWWLVLYIIPVVNFIIMIVVALDLAKRFNKSTLFAIGLILLAPIFWCVLGFGKSVYTPPPPHTP